MSFETDRVQRNKLMIGIMIFWLIICLAASIPVAIVDKRYDDSVWQRYALVGGTPLRNTLIIKTSLVKVPIMQIIAIPVLCK